MHMSNEEKDKIIMEALQKDIHVFSSNQLLETQIEEDINAHNIKIKRYTYGQRRFMLFLIIILCISLGFNAYFLKNGVNIDKNNNHYIAQEKINNEEEIIKNEVVENADSVSVENTNAHNEIDKNNTTNTENINEIAQINPKPDIIDVIVEDKGKEETNVALDIDKDILKEEIENYAISIGRMEGQIDTLEENTLAILMAYKDFSNRKIKNNDPKGAFKYASTAENVHLYITELTGTKIDKFLNSYANYIGYTELSNGYVLGKDGNVLNNEKYEVIDLKFGNKNKNSYKVYGTIKKTSDDKSCIYEFETTITIHEEYTYNPYKIQLFTAKLQKGEQDNVIRLVDLIKEEETKKK